MVLSSVSESRAEDKILEVKRERVPGFTGGCISTRYGCDSEGKARARPPEVESEKVKKLWWGQKMHVIGGCAGTRYGCDSDGKARARPAD